MKESKLISMVEFIFLQDEINGGFGQDEIDKVWNYAKFLSTPLTLGMFIPCTLDNVPLEEPKREAYNNIPEGFSFYNYSLNEYKEACKRVLFEGFEKTISTSFEENVPVSVVRLSKNKQVYIGIGFKNRKHKTIEDLVYHKLTLTENALKLSLIKQYYEKEKY